MLRSACEKDESLIKSIDRNWRVNQKEINSAPTKLGNPGGCASGLSVEWPGELSGHRLSGFLQSGQGH